MVPLVGDWHVVIEFSHPYEGASVEQGENGLAVVIPFMDRQSAEFAVAEMRTRIRDENPVIQGTVLAGEIER